MERSANIHSLQGFFRSAITTVAEGRTKAQENFSRRQFEKDGSSRALLDDEAIPHISISSGRSKGRGDLRIAIPFFPDALFGEISKRTQFGYRGQMPELRAILCPC
jgi:hypothetical protein